MAKDRYGYGTYQEGGVTKSEDRDIAEFVKRGYEYERTEGDKNFRLATPNVHFKDDKWIVKLNKEDAMEHVNFLENYLFSGSQNVPNMVYEIDGKHYKENYSFFKGPRLEEV